MATPAPEAGVPRPPPLAMATSARAEPGGALVRNGTPMALEAVPGFLHELHDIQADTLLRLAMAFVILTAKRSGEVRLAEKAEIRGRSRGSRGPWQCAR
jgi:hypothetical protein